jgi:hypothetical protein
MPYKDLYNRAKEKGLCTSCYKPNDRPDRAMCSKCTEYKRNYEFQNREFRREIGLCSRCGKNKVDGTEKHCPECRAERANYTDKYRKQNPDKVAEWSKKAREKQKQRAKEEHLCSRCLTPLADDYTYKTCHRCRAKMTEWKKVKRAEQGNMIQYWKSNGLCSYCGKTVRQGYKVCDEHYQHLVDIAHSEKVVAHRQEVKKRRNIEIQNIQKAKKIHNDK